LVSFNKYMVNSRRQRALQKDIEARKARLEELRELRVQSMQEAKMQQIEHDREVAEIKAEKEAKKRTLAQVMAQNTKLGIRATKDAYRDIRYKNDVAMDAEEEKLLHYIQVTRIAIIDTLIVTNHTNDAYIYDTYTT
jgi:asparagine N-glycosylation enzyme membrane subunit Stt3